MALIPPFFPDCVVAIGIEDPSGGERKWVASGFLYGHYIADNEDGTKSYKFILSQIDTYLKIYREYTSVLIQGQMNLHANTRLISWMKITHRYGSPIPTPK